MAQAKKLTRNKSNTSATVGYEAQEDDGEPVEQNMKRLTATLRQQVEATKLDAATCLRRGFGRQVAANLKGLGYGG